MLGYTVIHGGNPVRPWHRCALRVRNGHKIHIAELSMHKHYVRNVETSVQSCYSRDVLSSGHRKVQVIDMVMNDIELMCFPRYHFNHSYVMCERIHDFPAF